MINDYFKESINLKLEYDILFECMFDDIFVESSNNIFVNMYRIITGFINRKTEIFNLYLKKHRIEKKIKLINKFANNQDFKNVKIQVRGYGNKFNKFDTISLDDEITMLNNVLTRFIAKHDDAKTSVDHAKIEQLCQQYIENKASWDVWYDIDLKIIKPMYDITIENLYTEIKKLESSLYDFSSYINSYNIDEKDKEKISNTVFNTVKDSFNKKLDIFIMNLDAIQYEFNFVIKKKVSDDASKMVQPSMKKIMKKSVLYDTITYGEDTYNIYKTDIAHISCLNYGGNDIYIDKDFFDLPKGYQLSILYHEIGHQQCQHFKPNKFNKKSMNITVEDEEKLLKRIRKDTNKFLYHETMLSRYKHTNYDDLYNELLYLLVELDADRFAADNVGKRLTRLSGVSSARNVFPYMKNMNKDMVNYNMEVMKRRNYMM